MCRSRRELSNEYLLAKFGFDTADNEPCKVCPLSAYRSPRYGLVPLANALKGADSVMLQGAAIQAMLHVVEHPKAREYFLELGIEEDVSEIMNNAKDPFLLRVIKSFLELLNWKP